MNNVKLRVGIVGGFQMGKSTLVNCLLDGKVARTGGDGIPVTSTPTSYTYGDIPSVKYMKKGQTVWVCQLQQFLNDKAIPASIDQVVVTLWKPLLKYIDLIDTPGFKSNDKDTNTTQDAIKEIDFIIFLVNNKSLDSNEVEIFKSLYRNKKPFLILVNCINQGGVLWDPSAEQNKIILSEILARVKNIGCVPIPVNTQETVICNLIWYWYASGHYLNDSKPQIELIERQTEFFATNFLKLQKNSYQAIAEKSNFLSIRTLFDNDRKFGFTLNFMRWASIVNNSFIDWENNLKELLNKI